MMAVQPTSWRTFKSAKSSPPFLPKESFTVSIALRPVLPPMSPAKKNSAQPMTWPMTMARMPLPMPRGAK